MLLKRMFILLLYVSCTSFGQELKELEAQIEMAFDFGVEVQQEWKERTQLLEDLESEKKSWNTLTAQETALFEKYDETYYTMWDVEGGGCSWYCGAGNYSVTASSSLKSHYNNTYTINNIKDFSYETAWVEGNEDYGIGETIEFIFEPKHPRVTHIKIANGYVKNKTAWKNNTRVRTLKMFVNDKVYALIHLKDVYALQTIELENPIGHSDRVDFEKLIKMPAWNIKFEIIDVYQGEKYRDTVISEIFFDGLDVH